MLTIKGIEKLYRHDVGEWRISRIETLNGAYLIQLLKPNGEKHQINIERNEIGHGGYEMWMWKGNIGDPQNYKPVRIVLPKIDYTTMDETLKWLNKLVNR
jgi:hypothetical protein